MDPGQVLGSMTSEIGGAIELATLTTTTTTTVHCGASAFPGSHFWPAKLLLRLVLFYYS